MEQLIAQCIHLITQFIDIILHLDTHLNQWIVDFGVTGTYALMFLVIFCETGLVVTPFLPGDSLLFALGALTSSENAVMSLPILAASLVIAAIFGDAVNYAIGRRLGPKVFSSTTSRFLNPKHLERTQQFYERHGGKTIILARFVPIIRTFAPFVAGIGRMRYSRFASFNVIGGVAWVLLFLLAGHFFGTIPTVKRNFHIVIVAIIVISLLPIAIEWLKARAQANRSAPVIL